MLRGAASALRCCFLFRRASRAIGALFFSRTPPGYRAGLGRGCCGWKNERRARPVVLPPLPLPPLLRPRRPWQRAPGLGAGEGGGRRHGTRLPLWWWRRSQQVAFVIVIIIIIIIHHTTTTTSTRLLLLKTSCTVRRRVKGGGGCRRCWQERDGRWSRLLLLLLLLLKKKRCCELQSVHIHDWCSSSGSEHQVLEILPEWSSRGWWSLLLAHRSHCLVSLLSKSISLLSF